MMQLEWTTQKQDLEPSLVVVPVSSQISLEALEERFGRAVREAFDDSPFKGEPTDRFSYTTIENEALRRYLFIGVGNGLDSVRRTLKFGHDLVRAGHHAAAKHILIDLTGSPWLGTMLDDRLRFGQALAQGITLGSYSYDRYLSEPKPCRVEHVTVLAPDPEGAETIQQGQTIGSAVMFARDLGNGPGGLVTPTYLAETALQIVEDLKANHDVEVKILDRDACEAQGMGCYLGVAQGSAQPPKFIHLIYRPQGDRRGCIAAIGKGVTFDSGGYSLKPSAAMLDMKMDMCGAAAVIAAFKAAVELRVPWELHTIVAATENMIGPAAYRLGDVLKASNGKTVEINNTDAEGRLTLADALVYASKLKPDLMIDFATLTGACMVALGRTTAGVMSPDETLSRDWLAAAERSGESMWRLPLQPELKESLKSKVADMRNTGDSWGGAITAGLFLKEFIEGTRWLHVDLAGPSIAEKAHGVTTPGASGFGVSTLLEFLQGDITLTNA